MSKETEQKKHIETFDSKLQKFCVRKRIIFSFSFFFAILSINCQSVNTKQNSAETSYTNMKLMINKEIQFEDGLSLVLTSFTHKRPYYGGSTKATAHIMISKDEITAEKSLSIRGIEGKPDLQYDSLTWNEYEFQLKAFNYDESIEVNITKIKSEK